MNELTPLPNRDHEAKADAALPWLHGDDSLVENKLKIDDEYLRSEFNEILSGGFQKKVRISAG